jgi:hypothetical protein
MAAMVPSGTPWSMASLMAITAACTGAEEFITRNVWNIFRNGFKRKEMLHNIIP